MAQRQADSKAAVRIKQQSLALLKQQMQRLTQNPIDTTLKDEVISSFRSLGKPDISIMREVGLGLLRLYPLDSLAKQVVLAAATRSIPLVPKQGDFTSHKIYDLSLELLEQSSGDSRMKALVLELGRWHFGKLRHGSSTITDEQVIQNDIIVRS